MKIETATPADIPVLVQFQQSMAQETEGLELDSTIVTRGIKALFEDPAKGSYYVARDGEVISGCLMITYEWSDWRNGTVIWIQSVYIRPEYRRKGLFKSMYRHIQEIVENDNYLYGIRLYVERDNLTAQNVYKAIGMDGNHYHLYEWMK